MSKTTNNVSTCRDLLNNVSNGVCKYHVKIEIVSNLFLYNIQKLYFIHHSKDLGEYLILRLFSKKIPAECSKIPGRKSVF
jgi:hypothetical protein